jgi:hypothetical protein
MMFVPHREPQTFAVCYGDSFTFIYIGVMFLPHRKHSPLLAVTGIASLFCVDDARTSQEAQDPTVCCGDNFFNI